MFNSPSPMHVAFYVCFEGKLDVNLSYDSDFYESEGFDRYHLCGLLRSLHKKWRAILAT